MAVKVLKLDDEVDKMHSANYKKAEILYQNNQYSMQDIFSLIFVSRFIERAADHTKNIYSFSHTLLLFLHKKKRFF